MSSPFRARRRAAAAVALFGASIACWWSPVAAAPSAVVDPPTDMVSADALPTVQIDGVAWSQAIVGNRVFVAGSFANARPAGAAPGTNQTARRNLLAYRLESGALDTGFAPNLNAQALVVAASPDGSRVYVGGDFTQANGQARSRIAAYSTATGALIGSFRPNVGSQVRAIVATNSTVYVGGAFQGVGSTSRRNLAAFRASDGALLNWNPGTDHTVRALALSQDSSAVMVGGSFRNIGGVAQYGLAKVNASTGSVMAWNAQNTVRNAGNDAGVTSLTRRGSYVYGTAYHFGDGGNLEGSFKADVASGNVQWVTDCHGDNYSVHPDGRHAFTVGHSYYCGNIGGGFPHHSTKRFQYSMAFTDGPTGTHLREPHGYFNWEGFPSPSIVSWLPDLTIGSITGQSQAGWNITGNGEYLVIGGEFPRVNGVGQQGLVRFAKAPKAPLDQGPRFNGNRFAPTLLPVSTSAVRVAWQAGFDRDDLTLNYKVIRNGSFGSPAYTTSARSNWWTTPMLGFTDTGLTPGATYRYQLVADDGNGNVVYGSMVSITVPTSFSQSAHATRVIGDGASIYWPMNESSGADVFDRAGVTHAVAGSSVGRTGSGAVSGDGAATLNGSTSARVHSSAIVQAPDVFSAQVWIKTTTSSGGRILGFGDLREGASGHRDRQIWMDNGGKLWFGVRNSATKTLTSSRSYRDGNWHQVTATLGANGMALYVDGVLVAQRGDTTSGEDYLGAWRVGGDLLDGWSGKPSSNNIIGTVDEVAIYPRVLTQQQIVDQYVATGRQSPLQAPAADVAKDTFARTRAQGLGAADRGGAWSHSNVANFSVSAGSGRTKVKRSGGPSAFLGSVSKRGVSATVDLAFNKAPTGGGVYTSLIVRRTGSSYYRLKVRNQKSVTTVYLTRTIEGVETTLSSRRLSGLRYRVGDVLRLRFQVTGKSPATLAAKVWRAGYPEPAAWTLKKVNASPALKGHGSVGAKVYLSSNATNAPITAALDNFLVATASAG